MSVQFHLDFLLIHPPPKPLINEYRPRCQGDLSGDIRLGQAGCACVRYFFLGV